MLGQGFPNVGNTLVNKKLGINYFKCKIIIKNGSERHDNPEIAECNCQIKGCDVINYSLRVSE